MIKTVLALLENTWMELEVELFGQKNKVFGLCIVESVLSGSDYERSIDGTSLLGECISRLQ